MSESGDYYDGKSDPNVKTGVAMDDDEGSANVLGDEHRSGKQEGNETEQKLKPVKSEHSDADPRVKRPNVQITRLLLPPNHKDESCDRSGHCEEMEDAVHDFFEEMASREHLEAENGQCSEHHEQNHQDRVPVERLPCLAGVAPVYRACSQTSKLRW